MCDRPFGSTDEMDETLIARWNSVVRKGDVVWHLGDFAMKATAERIAEVFARLNGKKHLIIGNHDRAKTLTLPWASRPEHRAYLRHPAERLPIVLDHYAARTWSKSHHGAAHLYGHSHGTLPGFGRSLDVGVDCWGFRPVAWDEIAARLDAQSSEPQMVAC